MEHGRQLRFGQFVLDRDRGQLLDGDGAERFLRPKSWRLLCVLADRAGMLVSKDDLARLVWPDVIVSDDSVAQCVRDIRKAMGPAGARHIRTVPRRGYMLLPGREAAAPTAAARPGPPAVRLGAAAVLAALLAGLLLPTSLRPALDARLAPPGALEDAAAVSSHLLRADNLLDERDWTRRRENEAARALLEAVVARNPERPEPWASLGLTYWLEVRHLAWAGGRREMQQALDMVERSIALGPTPRAHRLLAEMRLLAPFEDMRDPVDALAAARAAVAMDPHDPDGLAVLAEVLALTGDPVGALALIERARRSNPNYPGWYGRTAGIAALLAGHPGRAADEFALLYDPREIMHERAWSGWLLAASLARRGDEAAAAAIVERAVQRRPGLTLEAAAASMDGFERPETIGPVLDGLRRAGLPHSG